ncbi:MAG: hypothetical protein HAW63_00765 [Bdellovibrionaceae bacterium]|nr:hypothetical protein [Pseudobdellovibrionaceae bacterium]
MKENILNLISTLQEQVKVLLIQIQEQTFYNVTKDYYQNSSVIIQKIIKYSCLALSVFIIIYIPYSFINASNMDIKVFLEHKNLAENLIQSKTKPLKSHHSHGPFAFDKIKQSIEQKLQKFQLSTQQSYKIKKINSGLIINVRWLNLEEFITISKILEKIHPQLKMTQLKMTPERRELYFNTVFIFKYFNIKQNIAKK